MELSREQRDAVERSGQDVCVVAGPGAGKTRVLTERFAWLVEQQSVDASRILAITFTEKGGYRDQAAADRPVRRAARPARIDRARVGFNHRRILRATLA
jgi:hypothetical protein